MGQRGRPPKSGTPRTKTKKAGSTFICSHCGNELPERSFYRSYGLFYKGNHTSLCKDCLEAVFMQYLQKYREEKHSEPERDAIRRICMCLDTYYNDKIFDGAVKTLESSPNMSLLASYCKVAQLNKKSYDDTITESGVFELPALSEVTNEVSERTIRFFGNGFTDEDYLYLQEQYDDWTTRHECNTKSQEEMFKQICFTQLELLKATRRGDDTKDLNATFLKQLDAAKLQPKQNYSETLSDTQTFGTLIDKWENTRPIPEVDEDLKDVDHIGSYLDVFFRGHLAKMLGLKNAVSHFYERYMKKYTVDSPNDDTDENTEALFDQIFGNASVIDSEP